jgi:cell division protein FtsI/penicillin-binding protein 2
MNTPDEVELLATDPTQPLLFRPTQGLYNPGWAMGWVAAAAVLAEDPAAAKATYDCSGAWQCGRMAVRCPQGHGRLTLAGALSRGCHVALTQAADRMGRDGFRRFLKAAHLLDMAGDLPLQSVAGRLPDLYDWRGRENLADTVIGNRFVRITPWAVARFFAALARQGQVAQPFLVSEVRSPSGRTAEAGRAQELGWAVSPEAASQLLQVLSTEAPRYTAATEQFRGGVDLGGVGVAAWWVPYPDRNGMGCGWLVAMSPMPQAQVLALLVLEDVADDKMAVELGLSLLNSLQRMAV